MVDKIFLLQQQNLKNPEKNFHPCSWFIKLFLHVPQFNMEVIVKKTIELFKDTVLQHGTLFFFGILCVTNSNVFVFLLRFPT